MRSVLSYAVKRGWLSYNPADQIRNYPEPDHPEYELTEEDEPKLYQELGPTYATRARLAILIGLRQSEQFDMERSWINLHNGHIGLPETKAGGSQIVFLAMEARTILSEILASHDQSTSFPAQRNDDPLTCENSICVPINRP